MVVDHRPSNIRPLERLIDDEATDKQEDVIDVIDDNPTMAFKDMAELGPEEYGTGEYTGSHYSDVYYKYFGPDDDPFGRSFADVKERYGSVKSYYQNRYELDDLDDIKREGGSGSTIEGKAGGLPLDPRTLLGGDRVELSGEIYDALKLGIKIGYELGQEDSRKRD